MYRRAQEIKSEKYIGENVLIRGWIHRIRKQKDKTFILLRDDRGGIVACVVPGNSCSELTVQSSIIIAGIVFKDERVKKVDLKLGAKLSKSLTLLNLIFQLENTKVLNCCWIIDILQ